MVKTMHVPEFSIQKDDGINGSFVIEPLHRGFGVTLGNALRRVLLSSLPGGAVTAFMVEGASHEFTTLPGVTEDLVQITLNLKQLRFRVFSADPQIVEINKKRKGPVRGADIAKTADVEVVNTSQLIATLDNAKASLQMRLRVEQGRGYSPVEDRAKEDLEVGMIAIDSTFSPITRVRYRVEHTRVGQVTGLDKVILDISTDGTITPTEALKQAASILVEHLVAIGGEQPVVGTGEGLEPNGAGEPDELNFGIEDLNFSSRTTNALVNNRISSVRDLVGLSDTDLKNLKGFGSKAYQEVLAKLKELELR